jgi:hypothetical protein
MARQPSLTVNVNSQQFQNFAKQFAQFSGQIKQLNASFAQINVQLNKTNILIRTAQVGVNIVVTGLQKVASLAGRITKHFLNWGTIIGGVTALLGMGGSLYGIERLASSIMQKRRQAMGLGGDYGRIQASSIFNQSLMGSPQQVMGNIQMGLHGAPDQMKSLMMMGINPFSTKMSSDEVMDKIVEKLPDVLRKAGPGKELMMAQAYGLDKIFTDPMDLIRLSTDEGRKEYQERRKLVEQYKEQMKISKPAQRAWTELELQFQAAKAQLESAFGEKLAVLAGPLKHLSDSFTQFIRVLMQSPAVQAVIKRLAGWIDDLAKKMKTLTEDDINAFIKQIQEWLPSMEQLKSAFADLVTILTGVNNALSWAKSWLPSSSPVAAAAQATGAGAVHGWLDKHLTPYGKNLLNFDSGIKKGDTAAPSTSAPSTAAPSTSAPSTSAPSTSAPSTAAPSFGAGATPFMGFGGKGGGLGGGPQLQTGAGASGFGWQQSVGVPAPGLSTGSMPSWPSAAQKMTPNQSVNDRFGNWTGSSTTPQKGGSRPGPMSMGNWQMNRVANLVVRNVPGSNVFMSAAGMVG